MEELELAIHDAGEVSRMDFDFTPVGLGRAFRAYYLVDIDDAQAARLVLHEGQRVEAFPYERIAADLRLVPYDAFALHLVHGRLAL